MSFEEEINKVKTEVEVAIRLIREKHSGANLEEARRFLSEAGEALKGDKFDKAVDLAKKAQLSARPTTEYLLSKAKENAASAENVFRSKNYTEAIELWKKAIEEYDRAGKLAQERKEQEILDSVSAIKNKLKENISKTENAIDNQKMLDLVAFANRDVEKANKLFEGKRFDEAKDAYDEAGESYRKALELAEKRNFADDKVKIEGALKSIETSGEASLLSKGDAMLREAEENLKKKNLAKAEESYSSVIKYLKGLNISGIKDLESMIASGKEGLIRSKLEQGRDKMGGAEKLFKSNKYYEAKEAYKASRNFFEGVRDEATGYKILNLMDELNNFVQACSQNITAASKALVDVGDVGGVEPEIVNVNEVGQGRANFRGAEYEKTVPEAVEKIKNKYVDWKYLGGGGFGDVYKARRKDGVVVAVKVPRNLDEKSEDVFFRELNTWEKLKHRNIVQLIKPYLKPEPHIEIEYVDGNSLHEALKSKSLDEERSCRVAFDIAGGLEYAHSRHIIHGDINPKNVLLNSIGEGKITDFGLAKIVTSSSELRGYTLPYASVEMLEKRMVSEKSDAYQLGLTFYIMLTGNNPFDTGSRFETEEKIKNHTPALPSQCNPKFSDLDDLIMRCLSKTPKARPSPREFRECIYEIIKKKYNVSLPLTENIQKNLTMSCNHAMMAAKADDMVECLSALNYAKGKVRDPEIRQDMKKLIEQVEFRAKNEISMEQFLDKMEIFMKKVEWEG